MRKLVLAIAALGSVLLMSCDSNRNTEKWTVASETRRCVGVGLMDCLQIMKEGDDGWQFFYGNIDGFSYEPGYEYVIRVKATPVENPPQDAPSVKYTLVEELSKTKKTSENMLFHTQWSSEGFQN